MEGVEVVDGLCSNQTIQALIQQKCMNDIFSLPSHLSATVISLIRSLSRHEVYDYFYSRSCGVDCAITLTDEGFLVYEEVKWSAVRGGQNPRLVFPGRSRVTLGRDAK